MKMLYKNLILLILFFSFSTLFAQETIKTYADNTLSEVTYAMSHPMHDWEGVNKNVRAVVKKNKETNGLTKVAVSLKIADFNSGNSNRDSHAVEVLDGIQYPAITFVSSEITKTETNINITGILTFHNVKKKITIPVHKKTEKGKEIYTGSFDVDMTEYAIKRPTLMNMPTDKIIKMRFFLVF